MKTLKSLTGYINEKLRTIECLNYIEATNTKLKKWYVKKIKWSRKRWKNKAKKNGWRTKFSMEQHRPYKTRQNQKKYEENERQIEVKMKKPKKVGWKTGALKWRTFRKNMYDLACIRKFKRSLAFTARKLRSD